MCGGAGVRDERWLGESGPSQLIVFVAALFYSWLGNRRCGVRWVKGFFIVGEGDVARLCS